VDINRFTEKVQEALQGAQRLATRFGHQQLDVEHVLLAMLDQDGGLAPAILSKAGISTDALKVSLHRELEKIPRVSGGGQEGPGLSRRLVNLLTTQAEAHAVREDVASPNLKVQMDLYHAQIVEGDLSEKIRRWLPHIGHFQIAGVPGRNEPEIGEVNYSFLFRLLEDLKYDGYIGCEYHPAQTTTAGLTWFYRLIDRK